MELDKNNKSSVNSLNTNEIGLDGIEFIEFTSTKPEELHQLFLAFGFSRTRRHKTKNIDLYEQGDIRFLLNAQPDSYGCHFANAHGPSICSMGWKFQNAANAYQLAKQRGAEACSRVDHIQKDGSKIPAIYGIGKSLIYFTDHLEGEGSDLYSRLGFQSLSHPDWVESKGFIAIDHLTNNVQNGTMNEWSGFYKNIFGFTEVRYFDIRGIKTGLQSYALRSPCGKFCIPINEASEEKSQINEYLREYRGPGIQHIAFLTKDILKSLSQLQGTSIKTLDIDPEYYQTVFERVPHVTENKMELQKNNVLVDGDEEGYLLQLFTQNVIGPIFIEIIQRKNHFSFGEGNFGALFRSIERDQAKRGVFE